MGMTQDKTRWELWRGPLLLSGLGNVGELRFAHLEVSAGSPRVSWGSVSRSPGESAAQHSRAWGTSEDGHCCGGAALSADPTCRD